MSDSILYLGSSNYCRVESGKMNHVGQSGSQTQINMDFRQVTIVTIILVKMKVEINVPIIFSHSRVLVCNPIQTWNGIYKNVPSDLL